MNLTLAQIAFGNESSELEAGNNEIEIYRKSGSRQSILRHLSADHTPVWLAATTVRVVRLSTGEG